MSVLKSVRIPEDVYEYICQYRGTGFNQKFVNIISDARDSEPARKRQLDHYDQQIRRYKDALLIVDNDIRKIQDKLRAL